MRHSQALGFVYQLQWLLLMAIGAEVQIFKYVSLPSTIDNLRYDNDYGVVVQGDKNF